MNHSHLIKGSSNTLFLGWFVLASAVAHFVFIGQGNNKVDKSSELSFSTPLNVTVISSRPRQKKQKVDPSPEQPTDIENFLDKEKLENSEQQVITSRTKSKSDSLNISREATISKKAKSTNKEPSKTETLVTENVITETTSPEPLQPAQTTINDSPQNHLKNKLMQAIKARFTYPRMARRMNWEGLVGISLHIEVDGTLRDIQIARTSGHKILDENARKTLEKIARINVASGYGIKPTNTEVDILYKLIE